MTTQLDPQTLMQQAKAETGLSDFGDPWFEMPLARLVDEVNQHAGLVSPESSAGVRIQSALSDRLKLVPGHCDPTANIHDWYVGVRNGRVECLWPISARGGMA